MIPEAFILEWRQKLPWPENYQVEQDLIIERALVDIFSHDKLASNLAFRGGTALHKLFLAPQVRYSEDIDLVQIVAGPIKDTIAAVQDQLNYLGKSTTQQTENSNKIFYRIDSEIPPIIRLRLKIEINTREHFSVFETRQIPWKVKSSWFRGETKIVTFSLEELLATKLRALYQRRKGRDLFDLSYAYSMTKVDTPKLLKAYDIYMGENKPSKKQFLKNLNEKLENQEFLNDMNSLLHPDIGYDVNEAMDLIIKEIINNM